MWFEEFSNKQNNQCVKFSMIKINELKWIKLPVKKSTNEWNN